MRLGKETMKPRWLKILLAILGGLALAMLGIAVFLDERREIAFERYLEKKRALLRRRKELEEQDALDQERLRQIEREMEEARREFLKKCAGSRDELSRVEAMSAEEVADETTRLEKILRRRLERL
jgi:hypothetical protein